MTEEEKARTRDWLRNWDALGPILEEFRRQEIRGVATVMSLAPFNSLFRTIIRQCPPEPTSGLIAQQALFAKARR